jgi:two-component system, NarL family, response regulator LiaR
MTIAMSHQSLSGDGCPSYATADRPPPLKIAAPGESELIRRGLAAQLEPFSTRVRLLGLDAGSDTTPADVLLFDCFPQPDSAEPCTAVQPRAAGLVVVAYTWHTRPERVRWALEHGFAGYVAKALPAEELVEALETVHAGRSAVALPRKVPARKTFHGATESDCLTRREAEVLDLVCSGLRNTEIALQLHLSLNSVKSYIRSAYRRVGVTTRSQAVVWGIENGFGARADLMAPDASPSLVDEVGAV